MTRLHKTLLLTLASLTPILTTSYSPAEDTCKSLAFILPYSTHFPTSATYTSLILSYWSLRQSDLHPACFLTPSTATDLAHAVRILTTRNTPFTVKSGGHTAFGGGSSIGPEGITIDLSRLNEVNVSPDQQSVWVGPGNRWVDVAERLDPHGLAVLGGRVWSVGVEGLLLGGGIGYFSGRRGFACDGVRTYEVVTASGKVVRASRRENNDLYWALRGGGGSEFGIVTRFELEAFGFGRMWASKRMYLANEANRTLVERFHQVAREIGKDPDAHTYFVILYEATLGGWLALSDEFHVTHNDTTKPPKVFEPFWDPQLPLLFEYTRFSNMSQLTREIETPLGQRWASWTYTMKMTANADLLLELVPLFKEHVERLFEAATAVGSTLSPHFVMQPITRRTMKAMEVNGGNALPLNHKDGDLILMELTAAWSHPSLDDFVERQTKEVIDKVDAIARAWRAKHPTGWVYMNYAAKPQDVYRGYGRENYSKLRKVAERWDPQCKFHKLWKGYFKLERKCKGGKHY